MEQIVKVEHKDIWSEGTKAILAYHKRTLLDFVDALAREATHPKERERLGRVKGRIHNDFGQATLSLGILLETFRRGGNIDAFKENIFGRGNPLRTKRIFEAKSRAKEIFNPVRVKNVNHKPEANINGEQKT